MAEMLVVIIDSGTGRSIPLLNQLKSIDGIRLQILEATMIRNLQDLDNLGVEYSDLEAQKLLRRSLTFPEIGCASSHNQARKLLSQSPYGGVILEDDARICDVLKFVQVSKHFLLNLHEGSAVLNLSNTSPLQHRCDQSGDGRLYFRKVISPSPLAVGYVCTSQAAMQLFRNNNPIQYVSDWPNKGVSFFVANHEFVHHGDGRTVSTIDPSQSSARNRKSIFRSISILFGFDFVVYTFRFGLNFTYFTEIWWRTLAHKVFFIRGRKFFV